MRKILLAIIALAWFLPSRGQELVVNFTYDTVCLGDSTHLTSNCRIIDTQIPPRDEIVAIAWDVNCDGKFDEGKDTANYSFRFKDAGYHCVGLKAITKNGLAKAASNFIPVNYLEPSFSAKSGCFQDTVVFTNETIIQGDPHVLYDWDFGDGSATDTNTNPHHKFIDYGQFQVGLTARFSVNCGTKVYNSWVTVKNKPVVVVNFAGDTIMHAGDTLIASVQGTYDSIRWLPTKDTTYTILITQGGYYSVKAYDGACPGQAGFNVTVKEHGSDPVVTNLVTPNGDGFNDRWKILNLADIKPCQVNVYNRYGIQVYSSSDYQNTWDGSFNGKQLANDTYYYFVRCYNLIEYKGNVSILK